MFLFNRIASLITASSIALFSVFALSGILRSNFGTSIDEASALGITITACTSLILARKLSPSSFQFNLYFALLLSAGCLHFFYQMHHPAFDGLPSIGGGDAGNHLEWSKLFATSQPQIYQSFSAFYSFLYWLSIAGQDNYFFAFKTTFYFSGFLTITIASFLALHLTHRSSFQALTFLTLSLACISYLPIERIFFPLIHYLQAEGFYPQLLAVPVMFFALSAYSLSNSSFMRIGLLLITIVFCRFTYGLNLGEMLLATSCVTFLESKDADNMLAKKLFAALSTALLIAAIYSYSLLLPILPIKGALLVCNLRFIQTGFALLCASSLIAAYMAKRQPISNPHLFRLFIFAFCYGSSAILFQLFASSIENVSAYYIQKHSYHPILLLSLSSVIGATHLIIALLSPPRLKVLYSLPLLVACFTALTGLWMFNTALQPIRVSYEERTRQQIQTTTLEPLADLTAWKYISETLESKNYKFGGFITPHWPQSNFTNAAFNFFGQLPLYHQGNVKIGKGHCVFWHSSKDSLQAYKAVGGEPLLAKISKLNKAKNVKLFSYSTNWNKQTQSISSACF